jgi:signal transduction histidine kinase
VGVVFALADLIVRKHIPAWGIAPVCAFGLVMGPAGTLSVVLPTLDLVLRPMLEDVLAHMPHDPDLTPRGFGLRTKVLAPLPILTVFGMLVVGAWSNVTSNGLLRLSLSLGISALAVAVACAVFAAAIRAVLDPVDELVAATQRVRAGDLETPIPIRGTDELAALTSSFNQMLEGLRERERLDAELRASRERIVSTADATRRRLERDLHDGAQQHLVLLGLRLGQARGLIHSDPDAAERMHDELRGDLDQAMAELRDLAHGIYPASLESDGLDGALREAVSRAGIDASLACEGTARYRAEVEAAVYFTCVEALQNAAKHAGSDAHAAVRLSQRNGSLEFEVADDGAGFDPARTGLPGGLQNMTDRIGALGGSLAIESAVGSGTRVAGTVPLN